MIYFAQNIPTLPNAPSGGAWVGGWFFTTSGVGLDYIVDSSAAGTADLYFNLAAGILLDNTYRWNQNLIITVNGVPVQYEDIFMEGADAPFTQSPFREVFISQIDLVQGRNVICIYTEADWMGLEVDYMTLKNASLAVTLSWRPNAANTIYHPDRPNG